MGMQNPEWTNTVATIVPYSFEMLSRWSSRYVAKTLMLPLLCFMSCSVVTLIILLIIVYFVLYRNNQIYKKGQSQRLKWLGQHNNNRGLLKEQTGLINLQN